MNLLCPNCQKPLTVPEQYAGQPMRCPLCAGTFTVPALPQSSAPPAPPPPAPPEPLPAPSGPSDVYGLKDPPRPPAPPVPDMGLGGAPSAPKPPPSYTSSPPPPAGPPHTYTEERPSYPSTPTPEGYQRKYTIWFSPQVLQYVAPVALFLVFILTFFAWTGIYPGRVARVTQSAWQASIGWYDVDANIGNLDKNAMPGFNFLLVFYLMLLFPTLLVTGGCLALAFVPPSKLPPQVYPVLPWRWGIVATLNLILLMFLALQLVLGFSLENTYIAAEGGAIAAKLKNERKDPEHPTTPEGQAEAIAAGEVSQQVSRTIWLDLVVFFHVLAIAGAGLMFCVGRRGGRPAAHIDMLW